MPLLPRITKYDVSYFKVTGKYPSDSQIHRKKAEEEEKALSA